MHALEWASNKQNGNAGSKVTSYGHITSHLATYDNSFNEWMGSDIISPSEWWCHSS